MELRELDLTEPLATVLWRLDPDGPAPSMRTLATALTRLSPDEQRHLSALLAKAGADPDRFTCRGPVG